MATKSLNIEHKDDVVVKFVGDSGDGMQLAGTILADNAAVTGNDISTFPDFPAEIRAPHNTIPGVSGFQIRIGHKKVLTSGDNCDIMVMMNPASLKSNIKWAKKGAVLIIDSDTFDAKAVEKAGYSENPLNNNSLKDYVLVQAPITSMTKEALVNFEVTSKIAERSKNMFALGMVMLLLNKNLDTTYLYFEKKFKKNQTIIDINKTVLKAGYDYASARKEFKITYNIPPAKMEKGRYRNITGNIATSWGFIAASERSKRPIYLGSYPITPATEILMELAKHKSLGVKVFQAEDEIAGICSAIGASFTGSLAITTTSGPGLSLKTEAIGLAVMTELPLVIVDVQRGGPSTGLPTKSEQSDLYQALFGRNGECPVVVIAASTSANCFYFAFEAAKLALEHMTPVILLSDGMLGFGSELFKIPKVSDLPKINPPIAEPNIPDYKPFKRDEKTFVRQWALPGTEGLRHRVGGLEKENITGNVSTDPLNHQLMTDLRSKKIQYVANKIPLQKVYGEESGDLLVVSWGGTYGSVLSAVDYAINQGLKVSHAHFNYIMPLPKNTKEVFSKFKKILVCELNAGQFVNYLRMTKPEKSYLQYNKVQGLPFTVAELFDKFNQILKEN